MWMWFVLVVPRGPHNSQSVFVLFSCYMRILMENHHFRAQFGSSLTLKSQLSDHLQMLQI